MERVKITAIGELSVFQQEIVLRYLGRQGLSPEIVVDEAEDEADSSYASYQELTEFGLAIGHSLNSISNLWTSLLRGSEKKEHFERNKKTHPDIASRYNLYGALGVEDFADSAQLVVIDGRAYELMRETNPDGNLVGRHHINLEVLRMMFERPALPEGIVNIGKSRRQLVIDFLIHKKPIDT